MHAAACSVEWPETTQRAWLQNATYFFGETCSIDHGKPCCCCPEFSETTDTNLTQVDVNKKVPSDNEQNQKRSESCAAVSSA